jgi:hypothetical protein
MPLLLLFDTVARIGAAGCGLVLERSNVLLEGAVLAHLEDGLSLDGLKLALEVFGTFGVGRRIGATPGIVQM